MRVHVLAIVDPGEETHPFVASLRSSRIACDTLVVPPRRYVMERRAVVAHCRRLQPDVVHLHGTRIDVADSGAIRTAGFRVVSTVHGFTGGDAKNRLYETLQRRALRRMDAAIAVSRAIGSRLLRSGVSADRIHVIPNAAPPAATPMSQGEARDALGLPRRGCVIGWVGRLTREKGCDVLLEAVSRLRRPTITVSIIGAGSEREFLERAAHATDLQGQVRWHGEIADAGRLLSAFDVLVISSRTEGTPMVLFEAIQSGVPIVTTAVGGIPDVVSPDEAVLVAPEDPAALALAIAWAIDDRQAAAERVTRSRALITHEYSLSRWIERYTLLYETLLPRSQRAPLPAGALVSV